PTADGAFDECTRRSQIRGNARVAARRGRRHRDDRHHRSRAGGARRSRLRRPARCRSNGRGERGVRRRRVGEGGERRLCADRRRDRREQRGGRGLARGGQRGRLCGVAFQDASGRSVGAVGVHGRERLQAVRREAGMSDKPALRALEAHDEFIARHIGTSPAAQEAMLREIGFASRAALIDAIVPPSIRLSSPLALPAPSSEAEALAKLRGIAAKNRVLKSFIGQGYYGTYTPGVIARNLFENPAWYTAYTPYQPEISQGRLEALLNFQTMIADLTGMEIANASMLDEATAAAEAMTLCQRAGTSKSRTFFVADDVFAQTIDVVRTRATPLGIDVVTGPASDAADAGAFGVLLQYPGADGDVGDHRALIDALHARNALVVAAADLLALTLVAPPGEWGADVVVGSSQRFGVPMGYGGPHAGYMATRDAFKRALPGRLVGVTVDAAGAPAY